MNWRTFHWLEIRFEHCYTDVYSPIFGHHFPWILYVILDAHSGNSVCFCSFFDN